jgi:hypothetical protein
MSSRKTTTTFAPSKPGKLIPEGRTLGDQLLDSRLLAGSYHEDLASHRYGSIAVMPTVALTWTWPPVSTVTMLPCQ